MRRSTRLIGLGSILLLAFVLRVWGLNNGLPYAQVTDESEDISSSLRIAAGGSPHYAYIRTAWNITHWVVLGPFYLYQKMTHPGFSTNDFAALYFTQRDQFILLSRLLTVALTSLAIIPAYFGGRALTKSESGGFLIALLLALHPTGVYLSHFALSDNLALVGVVLGLVGSIYIIQAGTRWAYILGGVGATIAMLGHLQTYPIVFAVALAHFAYWWKQPGRPRKLLLTRWGWAAGAFIISHLILNPYIILAPQAVLADISFIYHERFSTISSLDRRLALMSINLPTPFLMMRPYFVLLAVIGAVWAGVKRNVQALVIAIFGLIFVVSVLPAPGPRNTFWLQALVPAVFLAGYAITLLASSPNIWVRRLSVLATTIVIVVALGENVIMDRAMTATNTRMVAYDYITKNLPAGSSIMMGDPFSYSVPLIPTTQSIVRMQKMGSLPPSYTFQLEHAEKFTQPQFDLYGIDYRRSIVNDETWWSFVKANHVQYVIEADYCGGEPRYGAASGLEFPTISSAVRPKLKLIHTFSPFVTDNCEQRIENRTHMENMNLTGWERVGPLIRLYEIPDVSPGETF